MGAIGMGISRLSVDLATHFRGEIISADKMQVYKRLEIVNNKITHAEKQVVRHYLIGEIINSDKMQVYKGLGIVTNKIRHAEKQGVRHYLLGEIELDSDFTAENVRLKSIVYIEIFLKTQCVPIIVGGSNSY
uniref:Adenylate isopentenyltransferase n=1 Tax=Solanum tuberosum TaxID=4113 RepID=M1D8L6_SOLTU